jgi:hypothetical protein
MRTLTYLVASSLDGFIAGPDGSFDFFGPLDDSYVQYLSTEYPETISTPARQALGIDSPNKRFDTVLEGRGSYQVGLDAGLTDAYAHLRHLVFSRSVTESPNPAVEVVATDAVEKVRRLKQGRREGRLVVRRQHRRRRAARRDRRADRQDLPGRHRSGLPLFSGDFQSRAFTLNSSHVHDSGIAILTYVPTAPA